MDILSKDTLELVDTEEVRKAVEDLLSERAGASRVVKLRTPKPDASESEDAQPKKTVTLRRLAI